MPRRRQKRTTIQFALLLLVTCESATVWARAHQPAAPAQLVDQTSVEAEAAASVPDYDHVLVMGAAFVFPAPALRLTFGRWNSIPLARDAWLGWTALDIEARGYGAASPGAGEMGVIEEGSAQSWEAWSISVAPIHYERMLLHGNSLALILDARVHALNFSWRAVRDLDYTSDVKWDPMAEVGLRVPWLLRAGDEFSVYFVSAGFTYQVASTTHPARVAQGHGLHFDIRLDVGIVTRKR